MKTDIKPFLKWAGGKSQLLPQLRELFPSKIEKFDTFIEPFVGGGAVLFHILSCYPNIKNIVINDINSKLINTYVVVKEKPHELISILDELQSQYWKLNKEEQKQYYLVNRKWFNTPGVDFIELAALFIFLNRTCFNGLYRVNKKGEFNVPFGQHLKPLICNSRLIIKASKLLQKVTIQKGDYADIIGSLQGRSFIYFDPPYRPVSQTSNFTSYNVNGFDETQQKRLAVFCKFLDFDSKWMLSNSCIPGDNFYNKHYGEYSIRQIKARRSIGANPNSRGNTQELLITNY